MGILPRPQLTTVVTMPHIEDEEEPRGNTTRAGQSDASRESSHEADHQSSTVPPTTELQASGNTHDVQPRLFSATAREDTSSVLDRSI